MHLVKLMTFSLFVSWLPFMREGQGQIVLVLERLFPVDRGLYEVGSLTAGLHHLFSVLCTQDKVANFWCTVSPLIKFRYLPKGVQLGFR